MIQKLLELLILRCLELSKYKLINIANRVASKLMFVVTNNYAIQKRLNCRHHNININVDDEGFEIFYAQACLCKLTKNVLSLIS